MPCWTTHLLAAALALSSCAWAAPVCHEFTMPVFAKSNNRVILAPGVDLGSVSGVESILSSGIGALGQGAGSLPVAGTYNIAAKYCKPQRNAGAPASRATTVQLLLHGVPYNKYYWEGDHFPGGTQPYSWIDYATAQGYPTLAIDNLGAGNSSHPDPITVAQQPFQTELTHNIVTLLRAGALTRYGVATATKVVFVGHSLGSVVGNAIASRYPAALDALLLTGYTYTVLQGAIGLVGTELTPASAHDPARFAALPPGYVTFASRHGKRDTYYGAPGAFSRALADYDFGAEDVTTLGALATATAGLQKAANFTGDVLAVTGEQDALFCSVGSRAVEIPRCGRGARSIPARTKVLWPAANYAYHIPPGTGHAATLHFTTMESLRVAHEFLAKNGY